MADLKLVGAVAIKVRPDASGFKREAKRQLKKETAGLEAEVKLNPKLDGAEAKAQAKKLEKELDGKTISWNVKLDHDSVRAAQKQFDSMMEPTQEIKFKLGDDKSIKEAAAKLAEMAEKAKVKITYSEDERGFKSVLDKIAALRREKLEKTIHIGTSDEELDRLEKDMKRKLAKIAGNKLEIKGTSTIKLEYDENRQSLEETLAVIDRELAKFKDQTFYVEADKESLLKARAAVQEAVDNLPVTFEYEKNRASLEKTIKEIDAELEKVRPKLKIESLLDEASLLAARAKAQAELDDIQQTVEISYNVNRSSLQTAIDEINKALENIRKVDLEVGLNEFELAWVRADLEAAMARIPVTFEYDRNVAGLQKAIAEIDAELAKVGKVKIEATLDPLNLAFAKARLEAELGEQTVKIEYDEDLASLKAARAKIHSLLSIDSKLHIETELNDAALLEELARFDAMIEAAEEAAKIKVKVKPEISTADYIKALTALKLLAKSQTVDIFVKLNNASILLAAAKLTGLRAATKWTEAFARSLGTLDRNLPIVAAVMVGLSTLGSGMLSLTASAFSLGNGLGEVVRMAGLLAPAMILGLGAVMTVFKGVFKDFGAAVNGDTKAIDKLTESGKKAAAQIRVVFQDIRETVSANFWDRAGDSMLRFTETALPAVGDGLKKLSVSLGGVFSGVLDSFSTLTEQDGVKVFFENLTRGFDVAQGGMGAFMSGFNTLAVVGSTMFPRIGKAFEAWAGKFDSWVQRLAADGTLNRWIDRGIQGVKDLANAGGSLVKVWSNIGQAAQASGALTLHSFAQLAAKLDQVTAGDRFQRNMANIFRGARSASDEFHKSLADLGPAMDVFSVTIKNTLAGAGSALGAFVADLGDIMSSPRVDVGFTAFLTGIKSMFESLRPAMAPVTEILQTFGQILGAVARDSGPLFRNLFQQLATVLTTAWHALEPFLPGLIQIGTNIINVLGPALSTAASKIIPAFATAVQKIGDGLGPVITLLAHFGAEAAGFLASLPIPVLAALAASVLTLSGAFQFAATVAPVAAAGMQLFGIEAGIAGARAQLMIPILGIVLAALSGLAIGGVALLATSQKSAAPYANEYADALMADARAADEAAGAIGEATKKVAIKKLVDSGAYEAAHKLGIGTKTVTDAVLKGGKAWDYIQDKIGAATGAYDDSFNAAAKAVRGQQQFAGSVTGGPTAAMKELRDAAQLLGGEMDRNKGSFDAATAESKIYAEALEAAGIGADKATDSQKALATQSAKTSQYLGAAAAATTVLTDEFSSTTAKVDAMRKTFEIFVGGSAKQKAAETLGAYVSGFNNLRETVTPLAQEMRNLGDSVYGEDGFLNVGGGNKAVLQVNQALVDQVNNVWAGAKAAYDAAIKQGDSAKVAFQKSQEFITSHKGDYDQLAVDSGVAAEQVQGQWEAVFGHEWVLKVSLQGATEAALKAQELVTILGGQFDGKEYTAFMDANPDKAMLQITDTDAAAQAFVDHEWKTALDATPEPAQRALQQLLGMTDEQWVRGNFESILRVAKETPGLTEAVLAIFNAANADYKAIIYAAVNGVSVEVARGILDGLAAKRTADIEAVIRYTDPGPPPGIAGRGREFAIADGGILDQFGRGLHGFDPAQVKYFANGGIERHVAQIASGRGPVRIWGERETHGEAYIPYAQSKRPRSLAILSQVAKDFGYSLSKATEYANGGLPGRSSSPTNNNSASVHIGTLYTNDPDGAVRKLRQAQRDALSVYGITE